jgi:hypothetical protein
MLHRRINLLVTLLVATLFVVAGCGNDDPAHPGGTVSGGDDFAAIDFDLPYGGLTMTDEQPAFGDPELLALEGDVEAAGELYDDPVADEPEVREMIRRGEDPGEPDDPLRPQFTFVRILWGKLGDPGEPPVDGRLDDLVVDWSGELTVDRGIVVVRRVIGFHGPDSRLVLPRPDRQTVVWESHVGRGHHGLLIQIIEPPQRNREGLDEPDDPPAPNMLHFTTGPFTQSFEVCDLAEMDVSFEVDVADQAIRFTGFTLDNTHPCPQGMTMGRWIGNPSNDPVGGTFHGRWIGLNGPVMGYLRGAYGVNQDGERVFFGKYIARNGQFMGLLAGTWETGPRPGYGWFHGRWYGRGETLRGNLRGNFRVPDPHTVGAFHGRWSAICN